MILSFSREQGHQHSLNLCSVDLPPSQMGPFTCATFLVQFYGHEHFPDAVCNGLAVTLFVTLLLMDQTFYHSVFTLSALIADRSDILLSLL